MDKSTYWKPFIAISLIITGMGSYYTSKMQNIQTFSNPDGTQFKFFHPYMQTFAMFIGEFLCFIPYLYFKKTDPQTYEIRSRQAIQQGKKIHINPLLLAIPASCDFVSSTLQYFALNFIPGSIWQMLGGGTVITTLIFTRILIRTQKIKNYQYVGCFLSFSGMVIAGSATLIFSQNSESTNYPFGLQLLGYIMFIISLVINGLFYVVQQKILNNYYVQPMKIVGLEGFFGLIYCIIFIPILTFVHCPFTSDQACVRSENGIYYFQRPEMYFREIGQNTFLKIMVPLGILSISFLNVNGVTVTKYIGATLRPLLGLLRTIIVWMIGIVITVTAGKDTKKYQWQSLDLRIIFLQIIGYLTIVLGVNIYSTNIKVTCLIEADEGVVENNSGSQKQLKQQLLSNQDVILTK